MRFAVIGVAIGCSTGSSGSSGEHLAGCDTDTVAAYLSQQSERITDCDTVPPEALAESVVAASDCVEASHTEGRHFRVRLEEQGVEAIIPTTYLGLSLDGSYLVVELVEDSSYGTVSYWRECASFSVDTPCTAERPRDCFHCNPGYTARCRCISPANEVSCPATPATGE